MDADDDGLPDAWNDSCDATCQTNSALTLDDDPTEAAGSTDTDGSSDSGSGGGGPVGGFGLALLVLLGISRRVRAR